VDKLDKATLKQLTLVVQSVYPDAKPSTLFSEVVWFVDYKYRIQRRIFVLIRDLEDVLSYDTDKIYKYFSEEHVRKYGKNKEVLITIFTEHSSCSPITFTLTEEDQRAIENNTHLL
jgi:hypothetical protein